MRHLGRPRILICDDEPVVRAVCDRALTQAGYDPTGVSEGAEAVDAVTRSTFDAMLLDVRMPGMDGPDVLAAIREHDAELPVVVISGYTSFDDAIRCLRLGAVDFVKKPFDVDTIVRAVDRALGSTHLKADSAMLAASQSIFSSLDPMESARRVLRVARSLIRADAAALVLARDQGGSAESGKVLRLAGGDDVSEAAPLPGALWRRLVERHEAIILSRDQAGDGEAIELLAPGAHEVMIQRLVVGERTAGLLLAARLPGARPFGERDLRRATLVSGHAALALENARLHAATEAQTRRLEEAFDRLVVAERVAMVARLSASLGHEISNPACAMLANLELARDALDSGRSGELSEALRRCQVATNTILDVCGALRPLGARGSKRHELVDLRRVIDGAVLLATYEIRPRATLVLAVPENLPLVPGDPAKLGQVFLNLLLNSAQAIEPGDAESNEVRISVTADGDAVLARIEDTGKGVTPALAARLFQPSATTRAVGEGHGMGLAVCRWIVDEHGGTIRCVPDRPRGAAFEVRLPIRVSRGSDGDG